MHPEEAIHFDAVPPRGHERTYDVLKRYAGAILNLKVDRPAEILLELDLDDQGTHTLCCDLHERCVREGKGRGEARLHIKVSAEALRLAIEKGLKPVQMISFTGMQVHGNIDLAHAALDQLNSLYGIERRR